MYLLKIMILTGCWGCRAMWLTFSWGFCLVCSCFWIYMWTVIWYANIGLFIAFKSFKKYFSYLTCSLRSLSSIQFSRSVVSDSLRPHESHHARPPCPSPTPGVHSNSCPSSRWCHSTISSSVVLFSSPSIFPSIRVFSNESALCIRWPKYWSFSFNISPSNEHSGLISYMMDWLDLLAVQGTLKSLLPHHSSKASILRRSAFFTA